MDPLIYIYKARTWRVEGGVRVGSWRGGARRPIQGYVKLQENWILKSEGKDGDVGLADKSIGPRMKSEWQVLLTPPTSRGESLTSHGSHHHSHPSPFNMKVRCVYCETGEDGLIRWLEPLIRFDVQLSQVRFSMSLIHFLPIIPSKFIRNLKKVFNASGNISYKDRKGWPYDSYPMW